MESAAERILVVDSTKFGTIKPEYFAGLSEFHTVVTDDGADTEVRRTMKKLGIRIVVA